jgi:hypothetical protein
MAAEAKTITQRIGGNQTVVLIVAVTMLLCFTVASEILPALGMRNDPEYIRYTVNGKPVAMSGTEFTSSFAQWQRFSLPFGKQGQEMFLADLMQDSLAKEAGIEVPDATLRRWVETRTFFQDVDGTFDRATFDKVLLDQFRGMSVKAFEQEARRHIRLEHYNSLFVPVTVNVADADLYDRWKAEHPKVKLAYTWQAVAPLRAEMKIEEVTQEEMERWWTDVRHQKEFETPPRRTFDAVWIACDAVDDATYRAMREARAGDATLQVSDAEAREYWNSRRAFDFEMDRQDDAMLAKLRAENPDVVDEVPVKTPEDEEEDGDEGPPVLSDDQKFLRYWKHRITKELWLKKYVEGVLQEAISSGRPLVDVAETRAKDGLGLQILRQTEPVDQLEVDKLPGVGFPMCGLRYVLNDMHPAHEGNIHPHIIERSPLSNQLDTRGWLALQVQKVYPAAIPPLETVREKVASKVLDERAEDKARSKLEELRTTVQSAGGQLVTMAPGLGYEVSVTDFFNEFSWRPPLPRIPPGQEPPPPSEQWKNPDRRLGAILGRSFIFRGVPKGEFPAVIGDTFSTGAFYLVQVVDHAEPRFEEMTQSQKRQTLQGVQKVRFEKAAKDLSYDGLIDRMGLTIGGKKALRSGETAPVEETDPE